MSHYIMNDTEKICNAVGKTEKILPVSSPHRHPPPPIAEQFQWRITPPVPTQPLFRTPRPLLPSRQSLMK